MLGIIEEYQMKPNPFTIGSCVIGDKFFGRSTEIELVRTLLDAGSAVNIFGPTRLGKSSLLFQVEHLCRTNSDWNHFCPLVLDGEIIGIKKESIAEPLLYKLELLNQRGKPTYKVWSQIAAQIRRTTGRLLLIIDDAGSWLRGSENAPDLLALKALHQRDDLGAVNK